MVHVGPLGTVYACCGTYPGHRSDCWTRDPARLPWTSGWLATRCKARREPSLRVPYNPHGRCELEPHGEHIDHALRRATITYRWSTRWTA